MGNDLVVLGFHNEDVTVKPCAGPERSVVFGAHRFPSEPVEPVLLQVLLRQIPIVIFVERRHAQVILARDSLLLGLGLGVATQVERETNAAECGDLARPCEVLLLASAPAMDK